MALPKLDTLPFTPLREAATDLLIRGDELVLPLVLDVGRAEELALAVALVTRPTRNTEPS